MTEKTPLFSIITVTYNASSVIWPTLMSVKEQTMTDYEYLVVDGASRDATVQLVNTAQVPQTHVWSEEDSGLYDAMNKAIDFAKGKYLIFLNAGDAFAGSNVLARMANAAAEDADIIYGQTQLVNEERNVVGMRHLTAPRELTFQSFANGMVVCHQAFVAKRAIVGKYDLQYKYSSDYEWCLRCLQVSTKNVYLGDTPVISFLTQGLTHQHHQESLAERFQIMCQYFGKVSTVLRHVGFVPRYLMRKIKKQEKN